MDEELITLENEDITKQEGADQSIEVETAIDSIEVGPIEEIDIEMEDSMGWVGGDSTRHYSLVDRDEADSHPIKAITGLREELNQIEALQTVYSDKKQQADYYMWLQDAIPSDPYGVFVSIYPKTDNIYICDGDHDVFGVTVSEAAFVGGQEYVQADGGSKIGRDGSYCAVVYSGMVAVRCETSVAVGDYVVSNSRGEAKKSAGDYGYLVTALSDINGANHAIISLSTPSTLCKTIADGVQDLSERMVAAEYNIASVTNVANSAYALAQEAKDNAEMSSGYIEGKIEEVLDKMDETDGVLGTLSESVTNAIANAALAQITAEGAVSSANAMKDEAVTKANEALGAAYDTRKEVETKINEINTELDTTNLELQAAKEGFDATIDKLLDVEGEIAEFKTEVGDNYATTTQLTAVKTESAEAVAALKTEVSDTYATNASVAALKTETSEAMSAFEQEVSDTYATQAMLTAYQNASSEALTSYKTEVAENYATQEMVSTLKDDTTKALTAYKQEVTDIYATQDMVSSLKTETSEALSTYKQEVTETYVSQTYMSQFEADLVDALVVMEEAANETYASKSDLTSFESETNTAMANLSQKADANGAYIQGFVSNINKYSYGPYSQAHRFTYEEALNILEEGTIYVPDANHSVDTYRTEKYEGTDGYDAIECGFLKGYCYTWAKDTNDNKIKWIPSQSTSVVFSSQHVIGSDNMPYWVATEDITVDDISYEKDCLYKWDVRTIDGVEYKHWIKVASLQGNLSTVTTSILKQTSDSIEMAVTDLNNDYAGTKAWVDNNSANVESVVAWQSNVKDDVSSIATIKQTADAAGASIAQVVEAVGDNGEVTSASIVTAINNDTSGVTIKADHINMEGYVTFENLSTEGQTEIAGGNIKTENLSAISANLGTVISGCIQSSEDFTSGFQPIEWDETIDLDGFEFMFHDGSSGRTLTVTKGPNKEIVTIPKECVGEDGVVYKVVRIAREAFADLDKLQTVILHDEIISIGSGAFLGSTLQSISIPSSVQDIEALTFKNCQNLQNVQLSVGMTAIYANAFTNCTTLQTIDIPKTVSHIGSNSFENCMSLMSVTIASEDEVTISTNAFKDCVALESIIAPKNMIILKNAFYNCKNLKNVYSMSDVVNTSWKYRESSSGSNKSEYQGDDEYFTKATKYYYSDTAPATQDKYWHYSSNGFKISCDDDLMIDSRYFKVSSDGEVTANSGFIGGCTISSNSLSTANGKFSVNSAGYLTAKSGKIGGFYIETSGISSNGKGYGSDLIDGVYIGSEGIALGKGVFKVDNTGSLTATNADIKGTITATTGKIGSLSISNSVITGSYSESSNTYAYTIKPGLIKMGDIQITSTGVESSGSILRLGDYAEGSTAGPGIGISKNSGTITLLVGSDTGLKIRHTSSGGGNNALSGQTKSVTVGGTTLTFTCGILTGVS